MSEKKWVGGRPVGDERGELLGLIRKGNAAARRLLAVPSGWSMQTCSDRGTVG